MAEVRCGVKRMLGSELSVQEDSLLKNYGGKLGLVTHAVNSSTWEIEAS